MRYEMKLGLYGQDMYDNDLEEFLNEVECVEKLNSQAQQIEELKRENEKMREAYK